MEFISEYGLFLAKSVTVVIAILVVLIGIAAVSQRGKREQHGEIQVTALNKKYDEMEETLQDAVLKEHEIKQLHKDKKKQDKADKKNKKKESQTERRKRIYVLSFDGDTKASEVEDLREEITAVLTIAEPEDEVVLCLESPGGMVHTYGLAASQLTRITKKNIPLTIAVDAVAASGGYMMACIGNKIIAAPFAVIGSIGVIAQLPNFHRLLKKHDIDYEMYTAGEYKRTVTMFGENTDKGREKFTEELEDTHELFKQFVGEHRPQVNVEAVATGEVWYGQRAIEHQLIDELQTSDEYLMSQHKDCDIYEVNFVEKKSLQEKLGLAVSHSVDATLNRLWSRLTRERLF